MALPLPRPEFDSLNAAQREAAEYGTAALPGTVPGPLLVIAGAGTGKTTTLAHRVAALVVAGADPRRILLLTFTRRAAEVMTRRAARIVATHAGASAAAAAGGDTVGGCASAAELGAAAGRPGGDTVGGCASAAEPGVAAGASAPPGRGAPEGAHPGRGALRTARIEWSGTFHAVANRLLRLHAAAVGLDPSFTVLDRSDSADLLNLVRSDRGLARRDRRFPTKDTCLAIYSHAVNSGRGLEATLARAFPWCAEWAEELGGLFAAYVDAKAARHVLDYDDLLLYWYHLMSDAKASEPVRRRFDHVLVDEYQDTNALQAGILAGLAPDGRGLTVVGDDAQAIYSFRAATVRNILDFPARFDPPARVVTLEENYRSVQPILDAANAVIALGPEGFRKRLRSGRRSEQRPFLLTPRDEQAQADAVVETVLEHREAGTALRRQAVLFRTAHHSDLLEVELARRNIPFVKFGGLKFLEAGHVKDVLAILRWAENPRDDVAAFRVLQLLPGVGPASARRVTEGLAAAGWDVQALGALPVPAAARADWPGLCRLVGDLRASEWRGQLGRVRAWYEPHLERLYDAPHARVGDLEQLERLAAGHAARETFLTELTLDPPAAAGDEAGDPLLDEDYLILSTIHSAKGQEWDVVCVLNVVDGCIPSDMAAGTPEEIEEERRLLYVAMTRARDFLYLLQPHRFYTRGRVPGRDATGGPRGDDHIYAPRSRFIPDRLLDLFERPARAPVAPRDAAGGEPLGTVDVRARLRAMWRAR